MSTRLTQLTNMDMFHFSYVEYETNRSLVHLLYPLMTQNPDFLIRKLQGVKSHRPCLDRKPLPTPVGDVSIEKVYLPNKLSAQVKQHQFPVSCWWTS